MRLWSTTRGSLKKGWLIFGKDRLYPIIGDFFLLLFLLSTTKGMSFQQCETWKGFSPALGIFMMHPKKWRMLWMLKMREHQKCPDFVRLLHHGHWNEKQGHWVESDRKPQSNESLKNPHAWVYLLWYMFHEHFKTEVLPCRERGGLVCCY